MQVLSVLLVASCWLHATGLFVRLQVEDLTQPASYNSAGASSGPAAMTKPAAMAGAGVAANATALANAYASADASVAAIAGAASNAWAAANAVAATNFSAAVSASAATNASASVAVMSSAAVNVGAGSNATAATNATTASNASAFSDAERPPRLTGDIDDWKRPRMVVMDGCSGSSWVVAQTKYLFNLHGHPTSFLHQPELFVPWQNSFFTGNRKLGDAVELVNMEEIAHNKTLVFKGSSENLHIEDGKMAWTETVAPALRKMQTFAVYAWRSNVLDHAVCMVKDCFSLAYGTRNFSKASLGHPVDAKGAPRGECFARRKGNISSSDYKAYFNTDTLVEYLKSTYQNVAHERNKLRRTVNLDFNTVTAEDLSAFQYDHEKFHVSARAWFALLRSLGIQPNYAIIKSYLAQKVGTRPAPGRHSDAIYNIDEVQRALVTAGMGRLLRL